MQGPGWPPRLGPWGSVSAGHLGWGASHVHGHGSPLPARWRACQEVLASGAGRGRGSSGQWAPSLPGRLPSPGSDAVLALGRLRHPASRKFMVIATH